MKRRHAVFTHIAVLTIGVAAGFGWGVSQSWSVLWNQVADRESNDLMSRINVLSELRVGRTNDAVASLESFIDTQVLNIAFATDNELEINPARMPDRHLRALQMAKAYREFHPAAETVVTPSPSVIYEQIPSISDQVAAAKCNNAFCKLLQGRHGSNDNSAVELPGTSID